MENKSTAHMLKSQFQFEKSQGCLLETWGDLKKQGKQVGLFGAPVESYKGEAAQVKLRFDFILVHADSERSHEQEALREESREVTVQNSQKKVKCSRKHLSK